MSEEESSFLPSCSIPEGDGRDPLPYFLDERYHPPILPGQGYNPPFFLPMEEEEDEGENNQSSFLQSAGAGSLSVVPVHYMLLPGIDQESVTLFADETTTAL